jgi:TolA-binding protein
VSARCPRASELDAWERAGSGAASSLELDRHVQVCVVCRERVAEVRRLRALFATLPSVKIEGRRLEEMRFSLMQQTRERVSFVKRRPWRQLWALPVSAFVGFLALLVFRTVVQRPEPPLELRRDLAEIRLLPGADGRLLSVGPDETFSLLDGSAEFKVQSLHPGERFRVVVSASVLEVRGTRFTVSSQRGQLQAVVVSEGAVLVSDGDESTLVVAGGHWSRPNAPADAAARVVADTAPSAPALATGAEPRPGVRARARRLPNDRVALHGTERADMAKASDELFREARTLLRSGRAGLASRAFDKLVADEALDEQLRADAVYWSAEARRENADLLGAEARAEQYLDAAPKGWHAPHAALLLGEVLLELQQPARALPWLHRAAETGTSSVRIRAEQRLKQASTAVR